MTCWSFARRYLATSTASASRSHPHGFGAAAAPAGFRSWPAARRAMTQSWQRAYWRNARWTSCTEASLYRRATNGRAATTGTAASSRSTTAWQWALRGGLRARTWPSTEDPGVREQPCRFKKPMISLSVNRQVLESESQTAPMSDRADRCDECLPGVLLNTSKRRETDRPDIMIKIQGRQRPSFLASGTTWVPRRPPS